MNSRFRHHTPTFRRGGFILAAGFVLAGCGLSDPATPEITTIALSPHNMVLDAIGAEYPISAVIRDQAGGEVGAALLEWSSSDEGVVTVSPLGWVRAVAPGEAVVTARSAGAEGSARIRVEPNPARIDLLTGEGQGARAGEPLPEPILIQVMDRLGTPIPGAEVEVEGSDGGGAQGGTRHVADGEGRLALTWNLGTEPGTQFLTLRTGIRHTSWVLAEAHHDEGRVPFRIRLRYLSAVPAEARAAFEAAARRWESLIVEKLPPVLVRVPGGMCGANQPPMDEPVDDLLIFVTLESLGVGEGVGALANPCFLRQDGLLPIVGQLRLEVDDLEGLMAAGGLEPLVLHEIAHVLGVGSLWPLFELLRNPSLPDAPGADTHFTGPGAVAAFDAAGGAGYSGAKVPVENVEGEGGTRDRHWRTSVFGEELLTPFIRVGGENPLSRVTLASLADLGYRVALEGADPYTLPLPGALPPFRVEGVPAPLLEIRERGSHSPFLLFGEDGELRGTLTSLPPHRH